MKRKLEDLSEIEFITLKEMGMLWEFYPEAPADFGDIKHSIMACKPSIMRPCPFCGEDAEIEKEGLFWGKNIAIICSNPLCGMIVRTEFMDEYHAKKSWNKRA